ncbi:MAG: hypothetical protein WCK15_06795 [Pirellula sp.]
MEPHDDQEPFEPESLLSELSTDELLERLGRACTQDGKPNLPIGKQTLEDYLKARSDDDEQA